MRVGEQFTAANHSNKTIVSKRYRLFMWVSRNRLRSITMFACRPNHDQH